MIANKDAFDKLTPRAQEALRKAIADEMPIVTRTMDEEEGKLTQELATEGMVVSQPKPEDISAAQAKLRPYWAAWAKARGAEAVEALGKVRAALGN